MTFTVTILLTYLSMVEILKPSISAALCRYLVSLTLGFPACASRLQKLTTRLTKTAESGRGILLFVEIQICKWWFLCLTNFCVCTHLLLRYHMRCMVSLIYHQEQLTKPIVLTIWNNSILTLLCHKCFEQKKLDNTIVIHSYIVVSQNLTIMSMVTILSKYMLDLYILWVYIFFYSWNNIQLNILYFEKKTMFFFNFIKNAVRSLLLCSTMTFTLNI